MVQLAKTYDYSTMASSILLQCHMYFSTSNINNSSHKLSFQITMQAGDQKLRYNLLGQGCCLVVSCSQTTTFLLCVVQKVGSGTLAFRFPCNVPLHKRKVAVWLHETSCLVISYSL